MMTDPCREYLDEFGSIEKAFEQMGVAYCKMRCELAAAEAKISRGYVRRPVSVPRKPPKPAPPAIDDGWIGTGKSELEAMLKAQRESWVRAEMGWPKPRFKYVDGVKVYESYADYCAG